MQTVKDTIETLIEESFLLMLSEEELNEELDRFLGTCKSVIRENIRDSGRRRRLLRRINAIHSAYLGSEIESRGLRFLFVKGMKRHPRREDMVRRLAGIKRAVMKAVQESEPQILFIIEHDLTQLCLLSPFHRTAPTGKGFSFGKRWLPLVIAFAVLAVATVVVLLR